MHRDRAASCIPHEHDPFVGELVCILARRLTAYFCIIWVKRPYWNVVFSLHGTRTWLELGSFVIGKSCIGDISHPGKENYHIMKLLAWNTLAHCILWDCSESKCWFKSGSGIAKRTAMLSSFLLFPVSLFLLKKRETNWTSNAYLRKPLIVFICVAIYLFIYAMLTFTIIL